MWISSLVITLPPDSEQSARIRRAIDGAAVLQAGRQHGQQLPVVLETESGTQARYWFDWVSDLPGIIRVDVAFVSFDEAPAGGLIPDEPGNRE